MLTTINSERPTSFVPTRLITTTATISPMPITLPDQSGVAQGSSARTYPAKPAQ